MGAYDLCGAVHGEKGVFGATCQLPEGHVGNHVGQVSWRNEGSGPRDSDRIRELTAMIEDGTALKLREEAGVSRNEAARALGTDITTFFRWEKGQRTPRSYHAIRYHYFLMEMRAQLASH